MAQEIELKIRIDDHDAVRQTLRKLNAQRRGERFEINAFFDAAGALAARGDGLRLRSMRDESGTTRSVITFKGPATGDAIRSREEIEFTVGDFDAAALLLSRLGYTQTIAFEKRRETWELEDCLVELDDLPRLGTFLEIEGDGLERVDRVRQTLGLADVAPVMTGYARMVTQLLASEPAIGSTLRFATSS